MENGTKASGLSTEGFWENEETNFFGIGAEKDEIQEVVKEVLEDDEPEPAPEAKPADQKKGAQQAADPEGDNDDEDAPEEGFFGEDGKTPAGSAPEEAPEFFKTLANDFKEFGVLSNVEVPEEGIQSTEQLVELVEKELETRLDETFQSFFEELDEDGVAFLKYKKAGGSTQEFLKAWSSSKELPMADLKTTEGQKEVLRAYYKHIEKIDEEDIEDKIEWAIDNHKLEKYATKYDQVLREKEKERQDAFLLKQEQAMRDEEAQRKSYQKELAEVLDSLNEIGPLAITKDDKKELPVYATKPTVKVGKNRYITGLQADIYKVFSDKDKTNLLLLSKILRSNFDFTDIEKKIGTKVVDKARTVVSGRGSSIKKQTSPEKRSLSDFF